MNGLDGDIADLNGGFKDPNRVTNGTRDQGSKRTSSQAGKDVCNMEVDKTVRRFSERRDADDRPRLIVKDALPRSK